MSSTTRRSFVHAASSLAALSYVGRLRADDAKLPIAGIATSGTHIRQQIDGFGFSEAFHKARGIQNLPATKRDELLNLMFSSSGMGYSILRNIIGAAPAGTGKGNGETPSIEPMPNEFQWDGDEDQIWLMNEAKKRGCTRFMSSVWSPPAWMKTGNSVIGGELKPAMYQPFADYLATYVLEYKKRFDLDIYAISPTNEPKFKASYDSTAWNGTQLKKFLRENLIPTFAAKNVPAEILIDEQNDWHDDTINDILSDPACAKGIHIVAAHAYASTSAPYPDFSARTGIFKTVNEMGKRIWETEVSAGDKNITNMNDGVYWARVVHTHLTEDNVSAWLYWWGTGESDTRSQLVRLDLQAGTYQLSKRFFTIGHFARYIRPGYHRVDATPSPVKNTFFSAYLDPTGKRLVCVAINDDAVEHPFTIQPGDLKFATCTAVRTSSTETFSKQPPIVQTSGQWNVTTTPLSVTTFIFA